MRRIEPCCSAWRAVVALLALTAAPMAAQVSAPVPDSMRVPTAHAMGWGRETFVLTEVLEMAPDAASRPVLYDLVGWTGGASRRLWFKADGGAATQGRDAHGEYQLLYGRMISPWWDLQLGARADVRTGVAAGDARVGAVVAVQGLAPGWFEVEPSLFVSADGNVSMDFTASYDLFLTQRLVLQPRLEASATLRDDETLGIGRGLTSTSFGLRTRFEWRREVAPYAGVVWDRSYGRSADFARLAGESPAEAAFVAGLRLWW